MRSERLGNSPLFSTYLITPTVFVNAFPTQPAGFRRKLPGFRGRKGD